MHGNMNVKFEITTTVYRHIAVQCLSVSFTITKNLTLVK